jgi:hypothetical protein
MYSADMSAVVTRLFAELVDGTLDPRGAFILNSGDIGLLRSLDELSPADASCSVNDGASIAAHAQHVQIGLSLMNRWAKEGNDPFADPKWGPGMGDVRRRRGAVGANPKPVAQWVAGVASRARVAASDH